ncbi:enoyl-CoA hydratase/isomerase family protein [Gemmobacter sp.]|uniref:enoyl-CoA hydratase/isomerase family protein n=1 Tax=Gemmobacter sp. TaxID=1898957 RepID=UPI002AFE1657|nr:enoyl-CoA hydratase/isomerase family protein [Gemmobacter sp.]
MTATTPILVEHGPAISWIVFNRPDQANALSAEMLDAFSAALDMLKTGGAPVVGIRANGRGFCSGADLGKYGGTAAEGPAADAARLQRNVDRWLAMWDHPKPVIAAVHGYCMGIAAQLCVFADITLVAHDARIGEPGLPIGGGYIAPTWTALVGPKRAKEFAFLPGNWIDGRTAVSWGWANHSMPAGRLIPAAETLAARIAQVPPAVLRAKKAAINRAAEAQGWRLATAGIAETDALLHLEPEVLRIRARAAAEGLKPVLAQFAGPSSNEIAQDANRND